MKRILFALLVCTLFSAKPFKTNAPKDDLHFLQRGIERIIQQVDPNLNIGIEIVSLKNGQKFYEKNSDNLFVPASVHKIFTGASALSLLGVDFHFATQLLAMKEIVKGVLHGDVYLKGSGDPSLKTEDLENLVSELKRMGLTEITGNLHIDNFDFDEIVQGPGWMWDEGAEYWNSPLDALMVNHSSISVWVKPAAQIGSPPQVTLVPETSYASVQNLAQTTGSDPTLAVSRNWIAKENLIQVSGTIPPQSAPLHYEIPLESPSTYTAVLFHSLLEKQGIRLQGKILRNRAPKEAKLLVEHLSLPLSVLIWPMMKDTDNLYANSFFKKMGQIKNGVPGTWEKGGNAVRTFLSDQADLDTSAMVIRDGDGESRYNLVSPHQLVTFLTWVHNHFSTSAEFIASLPISGTDGTLKQRMKEVKGKVRAKTGSMTGITSIAGYALTKDNEPLVFAILINGFVKPVKEYKANLEDQICTLLATFSREN